MPMVFHSFCRAISLSAVDFQSVLSDSWRAFSTSSFFLSAFWAYFSFIALKKSALREKNTSHAVLKRSNIFTFIFCGANPMVFHSACMSIISFVRFSQSAAPLFSAATMVSTFSQRAVFLARFSSSLARISSKCCWWRLFITVEAALKRAHICSRSSLETGPISLYS